MTKPDLSVMLDRYNFNRQKERAYRDIAETYESEIIKILISKSKEARAEMSCDKCPLDPCKLTGDECSAFLNMVEVFQTLTNERESDEYLHPSVKEADS